jgi:protocatechuate 3,4-dioxygenase beta subunit
LVSPKNKEYAEAIMQKIIVCSLIFTFGICTCAHLQAADEKLTCSGAVVDSDNNPLSDVKLSLYLIKYRGFTSGRYSELFETKSTNSSGKFTFEIVPDSLPDRSSFLIIAEKEGLSLGWHNWPGREDSTPSIVLTAPAVFKGKVLDSDQKPATGAQVWVLAMLNSLGERPDYFINYQPLDVLVTTTDAQGVFEFKNIPQNVTAEFLVKKTGFGTVCTSQPQTMRSLRYSAGQSDIEITLSPEAIIKGAVTDPDNNPIKNATVNAKADYNRWGSTITQYPMPVTDKDGMFEVKALPAGYWYSLFVSADGYGSAYSRLQSQDQEDRSLDAGTIILPVADLQITGTVVDIDDKPVAGARLNIYDVGQPENCQAVSNKDGKFVFEKVCEGMVRITASCRTGSVSKVAYVETEAGTTDIKVVLMEGRGQTTFAPKKLPSLKGKEIPDMSDFTVKPDLADSGKHLLCFFDINQRPSRHCVKELTAKSEMLTEKGVTVVLIQAIGLKQQTLQQWSSENNITQMTAMIGEDEEKTLENWGVKGLPWLILTDKEHVVTAEGFNINELNDMLDKP